MGLILVDIDQVLAMNEGGDCQFGQGIFRTFVDFPQSIVSARQNSHTVVIITHRGRHEAMAILDAVGLSNHVDGVVNANDLFFESIRRVLKTRSFDGLSKHVAGELLTKRFAWTDPTKTVMIDDKAINLNQMIQSGIIKFGLQVPNIQYFPNNNIQTFNLDSIFKVAVNIVENRTFLYDNNIIPKVEFKKIGDNNDGANQPLNLKQKHGNFLLPDHPGVLKFPREEERLPESQLHTGKKLKPFNLDAVSLLRKLNNIRRSFWRKSNS